MKKFKALILALILSMSFSFPVFAGELTFPFFCWYDSSGYPLASGKLYSYVSETSTPKLLYSDKATTTPHTNPEILDTNGCTEIYGLGTYTLTLKDSTDTTTYFSIDGVVAGGQGGQVSYYYPNYAAADQGATGNNDTIKYAIDTCSTDSCTIYLANNSGSARTEYILDTDETAGKTIKFVFEEGAEIKPGSGDTLKAYSPEHLIAGPRQQIVDLTNNSTNPIDFTVGGDMHPGQLGCTGDGSTDDSTAMQYVLNIWKTKVDGARLLLAPGADYKINSALTVTFSTIVTGNLEIVGYGSKISSGVSSGTLLTMKADVLVRNLTIRGLRIDGSDDADNILIIDGGDGSVSDEYIYSLSLEDLWLEQFDGNGLHISNNVFESALTRVHSFGHTGNTTGYPIYFEHDSEGTISSIDVVNSSTRYGLYGLYVKSTAGDVKVTGGTYLEAQQYGIYLGNAFGSNITGVHVENNWASAGSHATTQAGIYLQNGGVISGCFGTGADATAYQTTLARIFAGNPVTLISNLIGGDMTTAYYIHGDANGYVHIIGDEIYDSANGTTVPISRTHIYDRDETSTATSGTGEDDLLSYSIPANVIGREGGIKIIAAGTKTAANGNKTIKLHFGASSWTFNAAANDTNDWFLEAYIYNVNALNSQRVTLRGWNGTTLVQDFEGIAVDTSAAVTVKITGECANAGDTITQFIWEVSAL